MAPRPNLPLIGGAALSAALALVHVGCIVFGAPWYRALGAEAMARQAEAGSWVPMAISLSLAIGVALSAWYVASGAGCGRRLPLLRPMLCTITAVYLFRGLAFGVFVPLFPGNPFSFWAWSSAASLLVGLVHLVGLHRAWTALDPAPDPFAF